MMETNLMNESQKNCTLSEKVGKLKHAIAAVTNQLGIERENAILAKEAQLSCEQRIKTLEERLRSGTAADEAIQETEANTSRLQEQYEKEAIVVGALRQELEEGRAELAELRSQKATLREREARAVVHVQALQTQADHLSLQLKEAEEGEAFPFLGALDDLLPCGGGSSVQGSDASEAMADEDNVSCKKMSFTMKWPTGATTQIHYEQG